MNKEEYEKSEHISKRYKLMQSVLKNLEEMDYSMVNAASFFLSGACTCFVSMDLTTEDVKYFLEMFLKEYAIQKKSGGVKKNVYE